MTAIYDDVKITINLNELVEIRAKLISQYEDYSDKVSKGEYLDGADIDRIAVKLRETLTWDTLYQMIDDSILDYLGIKHNHYGEIQPEPGRETYLNQIEKNKKQFEMVDLVSSSWTIKVPRRIK
tara:strand:+ start:133 stop:504 length:372 start_codon:yes stop_codon:yes gene_type:complete